MKRLQPSPEWPLTWVEAHAYDRQEIYGEVARHGYAYAYQNRRRVTLELLTGVVAPPASVADIAAAQGNFSLSLAELGYRVTWNDLRAELAEYVRLKHERGSIEFMPGNLFDLHRTETYDAVLITEVIEHVAHPDRFLQEAASLVRPGGYIVMTTPNGRYFRNTLPTFSECDDPSRYEAVQFRPNSDGHIFLLHPAEVVDLARQAGLTVDAFRLFTNPLTTGHMKSEAALRVLPEAFVDGVERLSQQLPNTLRERCMVHMAARFRKPSW